MEDHSDDCGMDLSCIGSEDMFVDLIDSTEPMSLNNDYDECDDLLRIMHVLRLSYSIGLYSPAC